MQILSPVFANNEEIPDKYTCKGVNVNPPLQFLDVPKDAQSLVLIVDDPDAPMGTWVHWAVYNMSSKEKGIGENIEPASGEGGLVSGGGKGYEGPCPPSGTHRYFFKLYALDTMLEFEKTPDRSAIEEAMKGHVLEEAELMGVYSA